MLCSKCKPSFRKRPPRRGFESSYLICFPLQADHLFAMESGFDRPCRLSSRMLLPPFRACTVAPSHFSRLRISRDISAPSRTLSSDLRRRHHIFGMHQVGLMPSRYWAMQCAVHCCKLCMVPKITILPFAHGSNRHPQETTKWQPVTLFRAPRRIKGGFFALSKASERTKKPTRNRAIAQCNRHIFLRIIGEPRESDANMEMVQHGGMAIRLQ